MRFRVTAAGFDPAVTTFAAAGLPSGARFDPATRLFQWRPAGDQSGSYPGVTFTATAGAAVASEPVLFTVTETVPTLSGVIRLSDGTPLAGAALRVGGTTERARTAFTDAAGRYRIEGTIPGRPVSVRLTKPTRRTYRIDPPSLSVLATSGDVVAPDLVATPK